ncbi:MAG: thioredoxin-disulfide reductase [Firmicutes bacterium]|nr:thioredoxin-disulfide reductase [Bacillota bacterium]
MGKAIYDVAIIGGGPAGMSAAIYAGRAHLRTCMLEGMSAGGQMFNTSTIENYPGFGIVDGPELSDKIEAQVRQWGTEIIYGQVTGIHRDREIFELSDAGGNLYQSRTVIVATGTKPRKLGVPGEEELIGSGVSYCATCDGAFFRDRDVAMIGGGDSAIEESLYLARIARRVTVIHRRDTLRAAKDLQERAFAEPRIEFLWDSSVEAILGQTSVEGVRVRNNKTQATSILPVAGVFIYIGTIPNTEFLQGLVPLDESGYIVAGEDTITTVPGLFVAGDIRTKGLRQIVTALADGAVAAMAAERYLGKWGL